MIKAFEEQLKKMAGDPQDQFLTHLKKRVGARKAALVSEELKEFILRTPAVVTRTHRYWVRLKSSSELKKTARFLLMYLYHPSNFLDIREYGLFGYLDDAYLAALVYEKLMSELQGHKVPLTAWDRHFLKDNRKFLKQVRSVIPKEALKIEKVVSDILSGNHYPFTTIFERENKRFFRVQNR